MTWVISCDFWGLLGSHDAALSVNCGRGHRQPNAEVRRPQERCDDAPYKLYMPARACACASAQCPGAGTRWGSSRVPLGKIRHKPLLVLNAWRLIDAGPGELVERELAKQGESAHTKYFAEKLEPATPFLIAIIPE